MKVNQRLQVIILQQLSQKGGGGAVDVLVSRKVLWPHEAILGGQIRQHLSYDQLSLTQFVQGFSKNILEEKNEKIREKMLSYVSDLMEDATYFSWSSAKAAHAVLLHALIASEVLMPKNIQTKMVKIGATKVIIPGNIGFVNYINLATVKIIGTMRVGVNCKSTSRKRLSFQA